MQAIGKRGFLIGVALLTGAVAIRARKRSRRSARSVTDETGRVGDLYDREAARYDSLIRVPERLLFADGRIWAASEAIGDVLEIAIGTGRNLPHYRPELRITGQDISPAMLQIARGRAKALGREVDLSAGDAQDLAFASEQFDSVVSTLALCTIPDERRSLSEAWRVLRPGGRLILLEHVRSPRRFVQALQRLLDPLAIRYAGDHLLRDPLDHLAHLGFSLEYCVRSRAGIVERLVARKVDAHADSTGGHFDA